MLIKNPFAMHHPKYSINDEMAQSSTSIADITVFSLTLDHPLDSRPSLQYAFVVCLIAQSSFGIFGNLMVIAAVLSSNTLKHVGNAFIVNLAVADLFVTAVAQPANILGALYGESYFNQKPIWCTLISTMCTTGCLASCWSLFMIGFNRYVLLCRWSLYAKVYTKRNTAFMVLITWIIVFTVHLPNHVGWGDLRFSKEFFVCTFANHVHSYAIFYVLVGIFTPLTACFVCYLAIYLKVRDCKLVRRRILNSRNVAETCNSRSKSPSSSQQYSLDALVTPTESCRRVPLSRLFLEELKIVQALFEVYVIFVAMWLPTILLILLHLENQIDHAWYVICLIIAHGNSSINCLVYAATLEQFRAAYKSLLRCGNRVAHNVDHLRNDPG